jgi:hypothetical protein
MLVIVFYASLDLPLDLYKKQHDFPHLKDIHSVNFDLFYESMNQLSR